MIFKGKFPIGPFDFILSGVLGNFQYIVVCSFFLGVVLLEELLFALILNPILIKKPLKGLVGIIDRVLLLKEFIIVGPSVFIRENFISFSHIMEFFLSMKPILFVLIRMPISSQFLIGLLNLEGGSTVGDFQNLIIVLKVTHDLFDGV